MLTPSQQDSLLGLLLRGASPQLACGKLEVDLADYCLSLDEDEQFRARLARTRALMTENVLAACYHSAMKGTATSITTWLRHFPPTQIASSSPTPNPPPDALDSLTDEEIDLQLRAYRAAASYEPAGSHQETPLHPAATDAAANPQSEIPDPQSEIPNPQSPTHSSFGFRHSSFPPAAPAPILNGSPSKPLAEKLMPAVTLLALTGVALAAAAPAAPDERPAERPNVVWVVVDDMSPHFACYGEKAIETPNLDRLAAEGVRFDKAFVTGPICSICRSALITGVYQTSLGAQNHRSGRGEHRIRLPDPVRLIPELMREAGYHTSNVSFADFTRPSARVAQNPKVAIAKTDYNFDWDESVYDRTHWSARPDGTPFFTQVQLHGGKHRGQGNGEKWPRQVEQTLGSRTPAESVTLPPYLPDDPVIREDWAQYLDAVRYTDWELGRIVERLREAGELDRTYVFFMTDHGISHVRNKQFLYDGGIRVPLVVRGPGLEPGTVRSDLVLQIDLAATTLGLLKHGSHELATRRSPPAAAGGAVETDAPAPPYRLREATVPGPEIPAWMHGRDLFAKGYQPRDFIVAARDRADETVDHIRAVRTADFKYVKNYFPNRPYLQPNAYKDGKPIVQAMRRLHAEGKLTPEQSLIMADTRPKEELYDLRSDPHELHNLAANPSYPGLLASLRQKLRRWEEETNDHGRHPEPPEVYAQEMNSVRNEGGGETVGGRPETRRNVDLMQRWATERPQVD